MNPRPRKSCIKRLRAFPVRWFSTATLETGKKRRLSPIDFGFRLRTEALDLLLQSDVLNPRAGPAGQNGYLETRRRMQTACYWQFCFPIVLRELGTRHDSPRQNQSRRNRCAPLPFQFSIECRPCRVRLLSRTLRRSSPRRTRTNSLLCFTSSS